MSKSKPEPACFSTIKLLTPEERRKQQEDKLKESGLLEAVNEELDEWVSICHPLGYMGFSEAMEHARNILELIEIHLNQQKEGEP